MRRFLAALLVLGLVTGGALAWLRLRRPPLPPPPSQERLEALRARRDELQARLRRLVVEKGEKSLSSAPQAGVMIGIPTGFTSSILQQVVTGLFGETILTLRNLKVHKAGDVKAKMLLSKRKIGDFVLDVEIHEVRGLLKPGTPTLGFGRNKVDLTLPVRLAEGQGEATLRFQWDSKGLAANVVCGDLDVTRTVTGTVVPQDYELAGSFGITATGDAIVLEPRFPDLAVRIFPDPTEQAWAVVDEVAKKQRKGCEVALSKIDIKAKLAGILGRGFNVKIPQKILKPVKLPAGLSQSLELQGVTLALDVKPTGILVAADRLWYGADLTLATKRRADR